MSIIPLTENFQNDFEFLWKKGPTPLVFRRVLHGEIFRKYDLPSRFLQTGIMQKNYNSVVKQKYFCNFVATTKQRHTFLYGSSRS